MFVETLAISVGVIIILILVAFIVGLMAGVSLAAS